MPEEIWEFPRIRGNKHGPNITGSPTRRVHIMPNLGTLVPNTIPEVVFGTRVLKWAVDGPFGLYKGTKTGRPNFGNSHSNLAGLAHDWNLVLLAARIINALRGVGG